jgi:hypothetical protein
MHAEIRVTPEFDYRAWVERARAFTDRCRRLPGTINVQAEIAPPMSEEEVDLLGPSLTQGIPETVRRFLTRGSGDCNCKYWWQPLADSAEREEMPWHSIFQYECFIYGGAQLCNPINRDVKDISHGRREIGRVGFRYLQGACVDMRDAIDSPDERELYRNAFPFLTIRNGDMLALSGPDPDAKDSVVYLSHEGLSCVLSPSFEDFLVTWERLCYVGPEIWLLNVFQDPKTGFIEGTCDKALALNDMFQRLLA